MRVTAGRRRFIAVGAATLIAGLPLSWASAATATATFTVTANVLTNCTIQAQNLNFGSYTGAILTGTTTITTDCSNGAPYNVGLNAGTAPGATVTTRKMTGPASSDLLSYTLSQDSAHSVNWGNTIGTDTVASTGTGAAQTFTVFGQIPASQFTTTGTYTDTITATLTF